MGLPGVWGNWWGVIIARLPTKHIVQIHKVHKCLRLETLMTTSSFIFIFRPLNILCMIQFAWQVLAFSSIFKLCKQSKTSDPETSLTQHDIAPLKWLRCKTTESFNRCFGPALGKPWLYCNWHCIVECGKEIHCHWITKAFGDTNYNIKNLFLLFHLLRINLSIKPVS